MSPKDPSEPKASGREPKAAKTPGKSGAPSTAKRSPRRAGKTGTPGPGRAKKQARRELGDVPFEPIDAFREAWRIGSRGEQLAEIRSLAQQTRAWFRGQGRVEAVRCRDVTLFPFPTGYGLYQVPTIPVPFFAMRHRMQIVQFRQKGERKTLLMNCTDPDRSSQTPYFRRLRDAAGERVTALLMERVVRFPLQLVREAGLRPEDVDYVTHDHMHTQDLRGILGTVPGDGGEPALEPEFPNAKVLVQRAELESLKRLHPLQEPWFVKDALRDVRRDNLVQLDGDYLLGDGVALVHTPGHTWGNHTLMLNTSRGIFGISENGVCPDSYSPEASRIPGMRRYRDRTGWEVVLNGNTLEGSMEQYTSMVLEKNLVDPCAENPSFVNMYQSSPLEHSPINPGIRPTFRIPRLEEGTLVAPGETRAAGEARR